MVLELPGISIKIQVMTESNLGDDNGDYHYLGDFHDCLEIQAQSLLGSLILEAAVHRTVWGRSVVSLGGSLVEWNVPQSRGMDLAVH